ncbi:MAG TPA: hypothetical protein ENI75_01335 [Mizugakiibacter sp.]|nr:hypothetical protein [Mizugakiibacter sp.]
MSDPADILDDVTALVEVHGSPQLVTRWRNSLAEFNKAGGRKTLCTCLGVEPYAQRFPSFRAARAARDQHVRAAYAAMKKPSIRRFQARLQSFLVRTWPGIQVYTRIPERLTTVERELFSALKIGRVPASVGGLHEILFGNSGE